MISSISVKSIGHNGEGGWYAWPGEMLHRPIAYDADRLAAVGKVVERALASGMTLANSVTIQMQRPRSFESFTHALREPREGAD